MGGVLIGLLEAKYDSKNRQHIELVRAPNLSGFIGLLPPKTVLYTPQLANILGMHGSSNGIIRIGMPKGVFTIYNILTKIITQTRNHVIFSSLESRIYCESRFESQEF